MDLNKPPKAAMSTLVRRAMMSRDYKLPPELKLLSYRSVVIE